MTMCENCGKRLVGKNAVLFSASLSGNSCRTYLCMRCNNNKTILKKMRRFNELKLDVMDGYISVQEFNKKVRVL